MVWTGRKGIVEVETVVVVSVCQNSPLVVFIWCFQERVARTKLTVVDVSVDVTYHRVSKLAHDSGAEYGAVKRSNVFSLDCLTVSVSVSVRVDVEAVTVVCSRETQLAKDTLSLV